MVPADVAAAPSPALREATVHHGGDCYLYDAARIAPEELAALFAPGAFEEVGGGRGAVGVRRHRGIEYAVRHYRRGGLLAPLSGDRYLWRGLGSSRPWREWRLLARLHQSRLPVPRPLAARLRHRGLVYRADLATARVPEAMTLAACLQHQPVAAAAWCALGAVLRRFHDNGVYHADLNANNVLCDAAGAWWLIDFDKARLRRMRGGWRTANLARLQRSLNKLMRTGHVRHFGTADWACLTRVTPPVGAGRTRSPGAPGSARRLALRAA